MERLRVKWIGLLLVGLSLGGCNDDQLDDMSQNSKEVARQSQELAKNSQDVAKQSERLADGIESIESRFSGVLQLLGLLQTDAPPAVTKNIEDIGASLPFHGETHKVRPIKGGKCVSAGIQKAYESLVAYDRYSQLDSADAEATSSGSVIGSSNPVKMIKSQAIRSDAPPFYADHSEILIQLQPLNLTDPNLYPSFELNCLTRWDAQKEGKPKSFEQVCTLEQSKEHFALIEFNLRLTGVEGCPLEKDASATDVYIDYELDLVTSVADVDQIKKAIESKYSFGQKAVSVYIQGFVENIFNEDAFFGSYFDRYYQKWVESLKH